jgi:endonuclease/exonuclease/phosphatase family metal-dependent hydrolase
MNRLSHATEPVLIAGDFNDWNARVDAYVTAALGLKNAFALRPMKEIRTWHARRPFFNLDRVYVRGLEVETAECLVGDPWTVLSDHLPLKVTLAL